MNKFQATVKPYVVFWLSAFPGSKPGYHTPAVSARFKDFADKTQAEEFATKLKSVETYQSRVVFNVTVNF